MHKFLSRCVFFSLQNYFARLEQLDFRLVEILTGEFMREFMPSLQKLHHEFFVFELTPFLAIVKNFIKEQSKT